MASATRLVTGQIDFSEGVDSGRVPTIAGTENPRGLRPTQVSWLDNATCRGGGIRTRTGWQRTLANFIGDTGVFQGAMFYTVPGTEAVPSGYPYLLFAISGQFYRFIIFPTPLLIPLGIPGGVNYTAAPKVYFVQAEEYVVIQAGDFIQTPIVWDGVALRLITDAHWQGGSGGNVMLPPGRNMDYFQGRIWVQNNERNYMAGDTVGGSSGHLAGFRDAVLHSTENAYLKGGGYFTVPSSSGSIRSIAHATNLNSALGDSNLFVSTRNTIYSVTAPTDRKSWVNIGDGTGATPLPGLLQTVAMTRFGVISDRSVVKSNGDLFFQAYDGVRSLYMAVRYFQQWGQTALSSNISRVTNFNDRALIHYASGIEFDNRLLQTMLPIHTASGIGFQALAVLDFDLLTSIQEKLAPAWEGIYEGMDWLQILESDFGGLQRAFGFAHSRQTDKIEIWELTGATRADNGDNRITWIVETPAYTWGDQWQPKLLDNAELWFDQIYGLLDIDIYFKPDQDPCWTFWYHTQVCAARNSCEKAVSPVCDYLEQTFCAQDRIPIVLPSAPGEKCSNSNNRPVNIGYQFQVRLVIKGWARLRGLRLWAIKRDKPPYEGLNVYPSPSLTKLPIGPPPPGPGPNPTVIITLAKNRSDGLMYPVNLQTFGGVVTWSLGDFPTADNPAQFGDYWVIKCVSDGQAYPVQLVTINGVVDWAIGGNPLGPATLEPDFVLVKNLTDNLYYPCQLIITNNVVEWSIGDSPI